MKTINLAILSQLHGNDSFSMFETIYSQREKNTTPEHEQESLYSFVLYLIAKCDIHFPKMNGFYFSYHIPQISKEFDILRISENAVLNIELKSGNIPLSEAQEQLRRNQYYLGHLQKKAFLFTFFRDNRLYQLVDGSLNEASPQDLADAFSATETYLETDIDALFSPSQFLISPLTTPERFLANEYFLTSRQEEIRDEIIGDIKRKRGRLFGITGKPGTGKTLVLYDLAKRLSQNFNCCIVHCAPLCDGHRLLNRKMTNCEIINAKQFSSSEFDCSKYDVFLFDEFHRAYENALEKALDLEDQGNRIIILSYDFGQRITRKEKNRNLYPRLQQTGKLKEIVLKGKIRTNKELALFIHLLMEPKKYRNDKGYTFANVEIIHSNSRTNTQKIIEMYTEMGYSHINHSVSLRKSDAFDSLNNTSLNAHKVFGQEFDKVLVVVNDAFYYEDGILKGIENKANPDYLYVDMLYEEITRVREKLCIVIENNLALLKEVLKLFPNGQE